MKKLCYALTVLGLLLMLGLALGANNAQAGPATVRATGTHSLNIPWISFLPGDILLFRTTNTDVGRFASQYSYWGHSAFFWDQANTLDAQPTGGVRITPNASWTGAEALVVKRYTKNLALGPTAMTKANQHYYNLPWNSNYANKWTTSAFYNSQFIWRAFYDQGVDLDSNYTKIGNLDIVTPDDIYYSTNLQTVWDSRGNMTCPDPLWKGQYYSNTALTGTPLVFCDSAVDFDWGLGSPSPSSPADNFAVRWTRTTGFAQTGTYRFHVRVDDGARLWVDKKLVINHWSGGLAREYYKDVPLSAGLHTITLEYFDQVWLASIKLRWEQR